jgi:hypothetical protein
MNAVRENLTEVVEGGQLPFREALTREWPRSGRDNRLGPDMTCPSPTDQKKRVPLLDEEAPLMIKVRSCQCPLMKYSPQEWLLESRPGTDDVGTSPYHHPSRGRGGALKHCRPVRLLQNAKDASEPRTATSPQCELTAHTKEKDLDGIEHILYTCFTGFAGRDHRLRKTKKAEGSRKFEARLVQ